MLNAYQEDPFPNPDYKDMETMLNAYQEDTFPNPDYKDMDT